MQRKTVIITGASRGIGRATAKIMALNGYDVVIQYNASEREARELLENIKNHGGNGILCKADVTKRDQVKEMVNKCIDTFGRVDVLVNNAGVSQSKLFLDISEQEWDWMIVRRVALQVWRWQLKRNEPA